MDNLNRKIQAFNVEVTFDSLREFIKSVSIDEINYEAHIKAPEVEGDYGRNIFSMQPFECVLINWPPGVESAVHHHKGLFGYVWVMEGELDNCSYRLEDGNLVEFAVDRYGRNGLVPEPDGVIHKLRNNDKNHRAITLHFYYPAIQSFEGMEIYNLETGELGILSDNAKTASWQLKEGHFKEVNEKAFEFVSYDKVNENKSHVISYLIPKPSNERINEMNASYFNEQASKYDFSDFNQPKRKSYIDSIDNLVAEAIQNKPIVQKHLDIATGTGRRALHIKEIAGVDYEIYGVDISKKMCDIAESRGLTTFHQDWANNDDHIGIHFDVITFLYAFGHIGTEDARIRTLKKAASYLSEDGLFYTDVFSLKNKNEWGAFAEKAFEEKRLGKFGYDLGDVFYKKKGFEEIAFLHYFTIEELHDLFGKCGLKIVGMKYVGYARNPGQMVGSEEEGNIFIEAKKAEG